jgi:hypothetical protein
MLSVVLLSVIILKVVVPFDSNRYGHKTVDNLKLKITDKKLGLLACFVAVSNSQILYVFVA